MSLGGEKMILRTSVCAVLLLGLLVVPAAVRAQDVDVGRIEVMGDVAGEPLASKVIITDKKTKAVVRFFSQKGWKSSGRISGRYCVGLL